MIVKSKDLTPIMPQFYFDPNFNSQNDDFVDFFHASKGSAG
jgi:hypothetical protein